MLSLNDEMHQKHSKFLPKTLGKLINSHIQKAQYSNFLTPNYSHGIFLTSEIKTDQLLLISVHLVVKIILLIVTYCTIFCLL
jgi:hypothetical protein